MIIIRKKMTIVAIVYNMRRPGPDPKAATPKKLEICLFFLILTNENAVFWLDFYHAYTNMYTNMSDKNRSKIQHSGAKHDIRNRDIYLLYIYLL